MREKLRLSDFTILYICISEVWETNARRCLSDAVYFRNLGGTSFILCLKNSILDEEAKKEDIPRLYFGGDLSNWKSFFNFYFQLQQIFLKRNFDLVHSYTYLTLIPIGFVLRKLPHIPLIFSFNEFISSKKRKWIDQFFISRTDLILTYSEELRHLALESFSISSRKVIVTGGGVDFLINRKNHQDPSKKKAVIIVPQSARDISEFSLVIDAISASAQFAHVKSKKFDIIFSFLSEIPWVSHPLYDSLKRLVLERHLEMHIGFETRRLNTDIFFDSLIYIGISNSEIFVDEDVFAFLSKTPLLLPRTISRHNLLNNGKFGESYHPSDMRELRIKLLKILEDLNRYEENFSQVDPHSFQFHHADNYFDLLYQSYERLSYQRLRYTQKKKKYL